MRREAEPRKAELKDFSIKPMVLYRYDEGIVIVEYISDLKGKSIEEFAREDPKDIRLLSVQAVRVGIGYVIIKGERVKIQTPPIEKLGGEIFIDGEVFTLDEVKDLNDPSLGNLVWHMKANRVKRSVKTRTGKWQDFRDGDSVISTRVPIENPA